MSFKNSYKIFSIFSISIILISNLFIPTLIENDKYSNDEVEQIYKNIYSSDFIWPIPGYTKISSKFGNRVSPTAGASTFHQGIDIPAPEGTNLVACCNATVSYIGFYGSAGYSIHLKLDNLVIQYHHVSPNFIVSKGDSIFAGQIIGQVGPKYVSNTKNNPYKDSNGKSTNGATTGPHLHFSIKKDGEAVNPLDYF